MWTGLLSVSVLWGNWNIIRRRSPAYPSGDQIGSGLVGGGLSPDELASDLHQRDNDKLLQTLFHLVDLGNSGIVVEHDEDRESSGLYWWDIGPGSWRAWWKCGGSRNCGSDHAGPESITGAI